MSDSVPKASSFANLTQPGNVTVTQTPKQEKRKPAHYITSLPQIRNFMATHMVWCSNLNMHSLCNLCHQQMPQASSTDPRPPLTNIKSVRQGNTSIVINDAKACGFDTSPVSQVFLLNSCYTSLQIKSHFTASGLTRWIPSFCNK